MERPCLMKKAGAFCFAQLVRIEKPAMEKGRSMAPTLSRNLCLTWCLASRVDQDFHAAVLRPTGIRVVAGHRLGRALTRSGDA